MGMMGIFDPACCKQAEECLARGLVVEAARILLPYKPQGHRRVLELLHEAAQRLVQEAQKLWEQEGALESALECVQLAAQCAALDGAGQVLREQLESALQRRRQAAQHRQQRLQQVHQLARQGHLHTAMDLLGVLQEDAEVQQVRRELEARLQTYRRHLQAVEECFQAGQIEAARRHWEQAKRLCPEEPELAEWACRLAQAMPPQAGGPSLLAAAAGTGEPLPGAAAARPARPLAFPGTSFVLDDWALVVCRPKVCVGTPQADEVELPLLGRLHRRHALLVLDGQGWQLVPLADRHGQTCPVWVDALLLQGPHRLGDGHRIRFGQEDPSACCWEFRCPVPDSPTAVLEAAPGSRSRIWTENLPRAILLADRLEVARSGAAHLIVPELPCRRLIFRSRPEGLCWEVEGGQGRLEIPGQTLQQDDRRLYVPSRLVLETTVDEAELLGLAAAGTEPQTHLRLELKEVLPG